MRRGGRKGLQEGLTSERRPVSFVLVLLALPADPHQNGPTQAFSASWKTAGTANFVVRSQVPGADAAEIAAICEERCRDCRTRWLEKPSGGHGAPRCEVVLHRSREGYLEAVGAGGGQTVGSSVVRIERGHIVSRRIDLLCEGDLGRALASLPHELVHLAFAERFRNTAPPRWAEEGAALLADSQEKQGLHRRDLHSALRNGSALRLRDLLAAQRYPGGPQRAVFYAQSLSLVEFLVERNSPRQFVHFVERSMQAGYDRALWEVYRIRGVRELERLWSRHAWATMQESADANAAAAASSR